MSYNKSPLAFDDVRDIFDRALDSQKGLRIPCASRSAAITLRSRFNYFRKANRKDNADMYPSDHSLHGKSMYDKLSLRVPPKGAPDEHVLYIELHTSSSLTVEEII